MSANISGGGPCGDRCGRNARCDGGLCVCNDGFSGNPNVACFRGKKCSINILYHILLMKIISYKQENYNVTLKQKRSTEGCSKFKVRRQDKFRRDWSRH